MGFLLTPPFCRSARPIPSLSTSQETPNHPCAPLFTHEDPSENNPKATHSSLIFLLMMLGVKVFYGQEHREKNHSQNPKPPLGSPNPL